MSYSTYKGKYLNMYTPKVTAWPALVAAGFTNVAGMKVMPWMFQTESMASMLQYQDSLPGNTKINNLDKCEAGFDSWSTSSRRSLESGGQLLNAIGLLVSLAYF